MATVVDVAVSGAAAFSLSVFIAIVFRYELDVNLVGTGLTAVCVSAAGLLIAVGLQGLVDVPFLWTVGGIGAVMLLFALLYEMVT
jgi:hypothetical protein